MVLSYFMVYNIFWFGDRRVVTYTIGQVIVQSLGAGIDAK
jgi:hypothetical protein